MMPPTRSRPVLFVASVVALCAEPALATTPVQPETPARHQGVWDLASGRARCVLRLGGATAASGAGWSIVRGRACLARLGLPATAWRLESDGMALVADDRSTIAFFSRMPSGEYRSATPGTSMVLTRRR